MKFGKKTAEAGKTEDTRGKTSESGKSLPALVAPFLVAGVLSIVAIALILQLYLTGANSSRKSALMEERLGAYGAMVQARVGQMQSRLASLAMAPGLREALASNDPEQLADREQWLTHQLPEIVAVRLLPTGINVADPASKPIISNVTLNLLRRAEKLDVPAAELVLPGQPGSHIALLMPVRENKVTRGVILAGFKPDLVNTLLKNVPALPGYLEVFQDQGGGVSVIGGIGEPGLKQGDPAASAALINSPWKLAYWPSEADPLAGNHDMLVVFIALALAAAVMGGLIWYSQQALARELQNDGSRLLKLLMDNYGSRFRVPTGLFTSRLFFDISSALARSASERVVEAQPAAAAAVRAGEVARAAQRGADVLEVAVVESEPVVDIDKSIFRAYDIRGVVDTQLTPEVVRQIGRAIGSEAYDRGEQKIVVARDGRLSGPYLLEALKQGLMESGRDVIDIGEVPTPVLYFATHYLDARSGVMLTGSHNPPDYNGLKIVLGGETLSGEDITRLYQRIVKGDLLSGIGSQEKASIIPDYIGHITADVALAQHLKIVIDCGNGVAGKVAPDLYRALGCEVIELYCEVDGNFPNHHPDPSKPDNLKELIERVKAEGADVGLAFDGDGDRLGVVSSDGTIIWPDRQMMLFAMDLLSRHPGSDIIFDVKCTRGLAKVISGHGGRPLMWKTGHSLIKAKMRETGALLAGERSGHIFIKERWYGFDDGLYAGSRLLEILALDFRKSADIFKILPDSIGTPELNLDIAEDKKFAYMDLLSKRGQFPGGEINTIDGIRVDYPDGWGLVRPSNTTPCLVIRFEADDEDALKRIQNTFRTQMLNLDASLRLPF